MEWITALLGGLIGALISQLLYWRTIAGLNRRVSALEEAVRDLREPEEELEPYGQQCVDLNEEYRQLLTAPTKASLLTEEAREMDRPLPVIRYLSVHGLLNLLPRKGIRLQPSLDGLGLKIVASYGCMERYKADTGESLEFDMKRVAENTSPDWELSVYHRAELMQYEFRILKHDGVVHE
jgi:hypothetical protein